MERWDSATTGNGATTGVTAGNYVITGYGEVT